MSFSFVWTILSTSATNLSVIFWASSRPFLIPPKPAMDGWWTLLSMNALLVSDGPGFQAVANEPLLTIESAEHQFHSSVHGQFR